MAQFEISGGVSPRCIADYFTDCAARGQEIRSLLIEKGGRLLVRASAAPYDCSDVRENYSVSKSLTTLAVGMLIGDGAFTLDDRIAVLLEDRVPNDADPRFAELSVRHLLSMQTGHDTDAMAKMSRAEDAFAVFCRHKIVHDPGRVFRYNTGASCALGCLVERYAKMPLFDFLTERLFFPLGITAVRENRTADGSAEGGIGFHLCADDLLKIGRLLLHNGTWEGKQLVPAWYLAQAGTKQASTAGLWDNLDSAIGYGFHFWMNSAGGFRADGSLGQYILVFPAQDTVAVLCAESQDVQIELDGIYALLSSLTEGEVQSAEAPCYLPLPKGEITPRRALYRLSENVFGQTRLTLLADGDAVRLVFSDGIRTQELRAGVGSWQESGLCMPYLKPKLCHVMVTERSEPIRISACACQEADGSIRLLLRHRTVPQREEWVLRFTDGELSVTSVSEEPLRADAHLFKGVRVG